MPSASVSRRQFQVLDAMDLEYLSLFLSLFLLDGNLFPFSSVS